MKRFAFALQALLDARTREEDACRGALAAAAQRAALGRAQEAGARARFAGSAEMFCAAASTLSGPALREALARLALLADAVAVTRAHAQRSAAQEVCARDAFAASRSERRRIEVVRDNARAAYERAVQRAETRQLEDGNAELHNAATFVARSLHN